MAGLLQDTLGWKLTSLGDDPVLSGSKASHHRHGECVLWTHPESPLQVALINHADMAGPHPVLLVMAKPCCASFANTYLLPGEIEQGLGSCPWWFLWPLVSGTIEQLPLLRGWMPLVFQPIFQ